MTTTITIERAKNGWIIQGKYYESDKKEVFTDMNDMLLAVYRALDDYHIDDRIEIHRKE